MQLTGLDNYSRFQTYLQELGYEDIDFVNNPETLEDPTWEVLSAFWFWESNKLGDYAKELTVDNFFKVSKKVNCGSVGSNCDKNDMPEPCSTCEPVGWPDRLERFNRLKELFPCN